MLKHEVSLEVENRTKVLITYKITGENIVATVEHLFNINLNVYEVDVTGSTPKVRIIDKSRHDAICNQLKREAMEHFHDNAIVEFRMNERW